jgi:hypothetical protein
MKPTAPNSFWDKRAREDLNFIKKPIVAVDAKMLSQSCGAFVLPIFNVH